MTDPGKGDRARLVISGAAHVVMPYHKKLDSMEERLRGEEEDRYHPQEAPCYMDKVNRGIRVEDLLCEDALREAVLNLRSRTGTSPGSMRRAPGLRGDLRTGLFVG